MQPPQNNNNAFPPVGANPIINPYGQHRGVGMTNIPNTSGMPNNSSGGIPNSSSVAPGVNLGMMQSNLNNSGRFQPPQLQQQPQGNTQNQSNDNSGTSNIEGHASNASSINNATVSNNLMEEE